MEIQRIRAKYFTPTNRSADIKWIVIHTMESPEKPDTAEAVARWFASPSAPRASAHFCVDSNSIVECVPVELIAWHAKGGNRNGIGIELAGRAAQTSADWDDPYSAAMLDNAAWLCAKLCKEWNIPPVLLSPLDLLRGERGMCGHVDITQAFRIPGGHWDPGKNFPWWSFCETVAELMEEPEAD